ncbi:uncharacterized protein VP01_3628g2, partial [Puccinia sorghi]
MNIMQASASPPSVPPVGNEMTSDSNDVPMIEASGKELGTAPTTDVNEPASNKTSRLDEICAQMKTTLSELRDPLRAMFLKCELMSPLQCDRFDEKI